MSWNVLCEIHTVFSWVAAHLPCLLWTSQKFSLVGFIIPDWNTLSLLNHTLSYGPPRIRGLAPYPSEPCWLEYPQFQGFQFESVLMRRFSYFLLFLPTNQRLWSYRGPKNESVYLFFILFRVTVDPQPFPETLARGGNTPRHCCTPIQELFCTPGIILHVTTMT